MVDSGVSRDRARIAMSIGRAVAGACRQGGNIFKDRSFSGFSRTRSAFMGSVFRRERFFCRSVYLHRGASDNVPRLKVPRRLSGIVPWFVGGKEAAVAFTRAQRQDATIQIRWLIRRDMPDVLSIERGSFEYAWTEEDFLCCLRQRNCIGMVAERDGHIVGFMIYELHKSRLRLLNFAIDPQARRQGIGAQMMLRLADKLSQQRRREIILEVRETNLAAQLFFRAVGFVALGVLRDRYDDTTEDAYLMRYVLADAEIASPFTSGNRIDEYGFSDAA